MSHQGEEEGDHKDKPSHCQGLMIQYVVASTGAQYSHVTVQSEE